MSKPLILTAKHPRRNCWRTSLDVIRVSNHCRIRDLSSSYSNEMYDHLQYMQLDYNKDRTDFIKRAATKYRIMLAVTMGSLIARAAIRGYDDMSDILGVRPSAGLVTSLENTSHARAATSADILLRTTLDRLPPAGTDLDPGDYIFSKQRADLAVGYEGVKGFKGGTLTAAKSGSREWGKQWLVSDSHDDDDTCDDNEAVGTIPIDDTFPSGDDTEPAHPNCGCTVIYRKMRR